MKQTLLHLVVLALVAFTLFASNIGAYDLWSPDEPRYAEVAREMHLFGDYLSPRVNGEPYKEKPPLLFWLMAGFGALFGEMGPWPARLPSILAGVATVLMTYGLARRLFDARTALWAGLMLITCARFWWQARFGQIDMLLTACLTGAFVCLWYWETQRAVKWLACVGVFTGLALLAKGPGVVVFPALFVLAFHWREKRQWFNPRWGICVVLALGLYLAWVIPARMAAAPELGSSAGEAMASNLFRQTIGRAVLGVNHVEGPLYYFRNLPVDWFPWSLFLPWTLWWTWRHRRDGEGMRFLLAWILPAFVFFSIALGKRAIYLLPLYPAMAILFARSILVLVDSRHQAWRRRTAHCWAAFLVLLGVAPFVLFFTEYQQAFTPWLLVITGACAALLLLLYFHGHRAGYANLHRILGAQMPVLLLLVAFIVLPGINPYKTARDFCAPVRTLSEAGQALRLFSFGFSREPYIFYAKHFHEPVFTELIEFKGSESLALFDNARLQDRMRREIQQAVEEVPVSSFDSLREEELRALDAAVRENIDAAGLDAGQLAHFEAALLRELDTLFTAMRGDVPAFMFIREKDWRWVLALYPRAGEMHVLRHEGVGSREVLLLANEPALAAVTQANGPVL